jgi:endoribonuclease L-PSP, putative
MKKAVYTNKAPKPIGPYSQAVIKDDMIFISGQVGIDPNTGKRGSTVEEQTKLALNNLEQILRSAGSSLDKVCKTTIILKDLADFETVNKVYSEFFKTEPPARTTFQANPPNGYLVEIEAIAIL